ncbi:hypothetical protein [uncultured Aquimarina sp.]|uniref:hypothetical protein n=1 Tax=uncultured Aquimarina sp. TaxID=575652 RepID=UPI00260885AC|nr:hypothetical protein [uncultured Aquimarina sp.]
MKKSYLIFLVVFSFIICSCSENDSDEIISTTTEFRIENTSAIDYSKVIFKNGELVYNFENISPDEITPYIMIDGNPEDSYVEISIEENGSLIQAQGFGFDGLGYDFDRESRKFTLQIEIDGNSTMLNIVND